MKKAEEAKLREELRQIHIENFYLKDTNDRLHDYYIQDLERLFTEQQKSPPDRCTEPRSARLHQPEQQKSYKFEEKLFNRTAFLLTMMSLCVFGFLLITSISKEKIEEMELQLIKQSEQKFESESISRPIIQYLNSRKEWEVKQFCE